MGLGILKARLDGLLQEGIFMQIAYISENHRRPPLLVINGGIRGRRGVVALDLAPDQAGRDADNQRDHDGNDRVRPDGNRRCRYEILDADHHSRSGDEGQGRTKGVGALGESAQDKGCLLYTSRCV